MQIFRKRCRAPAGLLTLFFFIASAAGAQAPDLSWELALPAGAKAERWRATVEVRPARDLALAAFVAAEPAPAASRQVAAGRLLFSLPAAGSWQLEVGAPGFLGASAQLAGVVEPTGLPALELRAYAAAELRIEAGGAPWPGALVLVQPSGDLYRPPWRPATLRLHSDAAGRVAIPGGMPCEVLVAGTGGPLWRGSLSLAPGAARVLAVAAAARSELTVVDAAGRPAAGVAVAVDGLLLAELTSAAGRLVFAAASAEPALRALAADGSWASRAAAAGDSAAGGPAAGAPSGTRLILAAPRRLPLRVFDRESRRPLGGAWIWPGGHPEILARSSASGEAELLIPWGGAATLAATAPAYRPLVAEASQAPMLLLAPAPPPGIAARGRVEDAAARAAEGAVVRWRPAGTRPPPREEEEASSASARSDAQGAFTFAGVAAGEIDLEVRAAGFAPALVRGLEVAPPAAGATGVAELGTVVLEPGVAIAGHVLGSDGQPLAGATVRVREPRERVLQEVSTPADGGFRFDDFAAGTEIELQAEHPAAQSAALLVRAGESPDIPVVLEAASRVAGRVVAGGAGVGGAVVLLRSGERARATARADAGGRFELKGVKPGLLGIEAVARGLFGDGFQLELAAGESVEDLEIELTPGAVVFGRMLSGDGEPLAGVRVEAIGEEQDLRAQLAVSPAYSAADGSYRLEGLAPGRRRLQARRADLLAAEQTVEAAGGRQELDWRLEAGLRVGGRIVDSERQPVAGARIAAFGADGRAVGDGVQSDADGRFTLEGLAAGALRVVGDSDRGPSAEQSLVLAAGGEPPELLLVCPAPASVEGRLLGASFEALSRAQVWAMAKNGQHRPGQVAFDGSYRIGRLAAGEWRVFARAPGFPREANGSTVLRDGERGSLDLELSREGYRLRGAVFRGHEPQAGLRVVAGSENGAGGGGLTDAGGGFAIEALPAGRYYLTVLGPGVNRTRLIELTGDLDLDLDLDLENDRENERAAPQDATAAPTLPTEENP